jgi:ParB family chromosome partitioning protein
MGRKTIRKNGVPYTDAERAKRYRRGKRNVGGYGYEWFTPKEYINAARKVLGSIDLDPASCELAQTVVRAKKYFTKDDDGLTKEWVAKNVWLNAPYTPRVLGQFANKLLDEIALGNVKNAILMVHSRSTGTKWFQRAATDAECFCLPKKRINCWSPNYDSNPGIPPSSSILLYFGANAARFRKVFSQFGFVSK